MACVGIKLFADAEAGWGALADLYDEPPSEAGARRAVAEPSVRAVGFTFEQCRYPSCRSPKRTRNHSPETSATEAIWPAASVPTATGPTSGQLNICVFDAVAATSAGGAPRFARSQALAAGVDAWVRAAAAADCDLRAVPVPLDF